MRVLCFLVPCLAVGMAALADSFTNDLVPEDHYLPLRRQTTNSSRIVYELAETYDATNFWDKFEFVEVRTSVPLFCLSLQFHFISFQNLMHRNHPQTTPTNGDPTHGFVLYQNRSEAERLGLISVDGDVATMKVEHTTTITGTNLTNMGRKSVRVESLATYKEGLIVADFAQVPKKQCGSWPAL